jgi:hypothetical protein
VNAKQLAAALRERADRNDDERLYDQNASELIRVLARVVEGKPIDRAFGAPGDWGYSTAIGQALAAKPATVPAGDASLLTAAKRLIEDTRFDYFANSNCPDGQEDDGVRIWNDLVAAVYAADPEHGAKGK